MARLKAEERMFWRADQLRSADPPALKLPIYLIVGDKPVSLEKTEEVPGRKDEDGAENGPLAIWRNWADNVDGTAIDAGHFVCEENPQATLAALLPFLRQ